MVRPGGSGRSYARVPRSYVLQPEDHEDVKIKVNKIVHAYDL